MATVLSIIAAVPIIFQDILLWCAIALTVISTIEYIVIGEKRLGEWN